MSAEVVCIIPALNAESTVGQVVASVRRAVPGVFVLGVDDGSSDFTRSILRRTCDHCIEFEHNRGKGAALRAGFAWVTEHDSRGVLTIDADGQHDAAFAPQLLAGLSSAGIVIGIRDITTTTVPVHRRVANWLSTAATRAVTKHSIHDSQSGFRAIRVDVIRAIRAAGDRYEFETDFLVRAVRAGYTIAEVRVPTIYGPASHFREVSDALRVARVLWGHRGALFR